MGIKREALLAFLTNLLRTTEAKRVKWTDTPDENIFRTVLKEGAVLIERNRPGPNLFTHRAILLNANNAPIADFQANDRSEEDMLGNLFNAARDSALSTEDVFRNLVGELERLSK